ncbi:hypothetical protein Trydic_g6686 [Trypoxylus dichotomus]
MLWLLNYSGLEQLVIIATIVFLTILLAEIFDCSKIFSGSDASHLNYGYASHNGPITWKCSFPNSRGKCQSPINITTKNVVCVPAETFKPIKFSSEYYDLPASTVVMNDGHTLVLYHCWNRNRVPKICGGPLKDVYRFDSLRFRWGPNDEEGSEHTIDARRYAMEVQAIHVKDNKKYSYLYEAADDKAVMVISYLFEITPVDNPYLDPLVASLKDIQSPCSQCVVQSFPLSWLILPFTSKYYCYCGSLTFPPCTEHVDWLVQSETMSVSSRQMQKFRKLCSLDGPMDTNARPVQDLNGRNIYFYD